jgi:hypothetical protein
MAPLTVSFRVTPLIRIHGAGAWGSELRMAIELNPKVGIRTESRFELQNPKGPERLLAAGPGTSVSKLFPWRCEYSPG